MPIDPGRVKELFNSVLDLPEPADRAAFLDRECGGDSGIADDVWMHSWPRTTNRPAAGAPPRGEPRRKLRMEPSRIRRPPVPSRRQATGDRRPAISKKRRSPDSLIGSIIAGRYKLRQEIGEGGMGSVYLAEQTQPVKRHGGARSSSSPAWTRRPSWPGSSRSARPWL